MLMTRNQVSETTIRGSDVTSNDGSTLRLKAIAQIETSISRLTNGGGTRNSIDDSSDFVINYVGKKSNRNLPPTVIHSFRTKLEPH